MTGTHSPWSTLAGAAPRMKKVLVPFLVVISSAYFLLCLIILVSSDPARDRHWRVESPVSTAGAVEARAEGLRRMEHFEDMLVAIGSIELGILAFVGTVLFSKDVHTLERKRTFFFLVVVLVVVTSFAYLHVYRLTVAYGRYILTMERALPRGLRVLADTMQIANEPSVPRMFHTVVAKITATYAVVAFYPLTLTVVAIVAFGRKLRVPTSWQLALLLVVSGSALVYVWPDVLDIVALSAIVHSLP